MTRFTGSDVPELARRIRDMWQRDGSHVLTSQEGFWNMDSRIRGTTSEVVQWRSGAGGRELIWSHLDLLAPVRPVPSPGLALPAGCAWGRSIYGMSGTRSYLQRSARCIQSMPVLSHQLHQSMASQGWHVRIARADGLQMERTGTEGFISLSSPEGDRGTWLTWLRIEGRP
jgi:hypothetical protein